MDEADIAFVYFNPETLKHKKLPWEGWMWHPERDERFLEIHHERFKELINIEI